MQKYKDTWLSKYKHIPESAHGFPTCMYTISLEAWRRGLKVRFDMKRSKSLMTGLSYTVINGNREHTFHGSRGDQTEREAIKICIDKALTLKYLRDANVPVPEGKDFPNDTNTNELLHYANYLGYPLVLKPGTGGRSGGFGVVTNIKTNKDMERYITHLKRIAPKSSILIERFFVGEDYRINVFNGKVIGAFHRRAQSVIGDGKKTLAQLLELKNHERAASPFLSNSKISMDKKMKAFLAESNKTPRYIPAEGERVYLRRNGEFFGQRDAVNVTDTLPEEMLTIAKNAVKTIPGLHIGGVDMLIDIEKGECVINEINSLPQISNHIFPMEGNAIDIPRIIMDYYFPETKYEEAPNTHYYYDYQPILENFRNGTTSELTLPRIPKRKHIRRQFKITGKNFTERYFNRMKKEAATNSINGSAVKVDEFNVVYTISGSNNRLNNFRQFIKKPPYKSVKIEHVEEIKYKGPITIGFQVESQGPSYLKKSGNRLVGFMRNFKKPTDIAYLTAKMSKYHGIDIIYFTPQSIDMKSNLAIGKVLKGEKWVSEKVALPKLIDISPYCFNKKNRELIRYLRRNTYLTDNRKNVISKERLQEELKKDPMFSHLVIPTVRLESANTIIKQLKSYDAVVLKPIKGERGKGIYVVRKEGRKYIVGHNKEEQKLSKRGLSKLFRQKLSKGYIVQEYISSRSLNGDPFDCRIHFEKNGIGKWEIAKMYIRIGIGQTVISNMNQGGGMATPENYLKANFPDQWKDIYQQLLNLGRVFPYKFEDLRGTDIMSLGIDVGIDKSGDIFIFEANGAPSTSALKAEAVNLRTQYYKFLLEHEIK